MAIYCLFLQKSNVFRRLAAFVLNMSECFNQKSTRATCRVIHLVAKLRVYQINYQLHNMPRREILTKISTNTDGVFQKILERISFNIRVGIKQFNADSLSTIFLRLSGLLISKCLWNT